MRRHGRGRTTIGLEKSPRGGLVAGATSSGKEGPFATGVKPSHMLRYLGKTPNSIAQRKLSRRRLGALNALLELFSEGRRVLLSGVLLRAGVGKVDHLSTPSNSVYNDLWF